MSKSPPKEPGAAAPGTNQSGSVGQPHSHGLSDLATETPAVRQARRVGPWLASIMLHILMITLGFLVTWTVVSMRSDESPAVIVADFDAPAFEPVSVSPGQSAQVDSPRVPDRVRPEQMMDAVGASPSPDEALDWISDAAPQSPSTPFAPQRADGRAEFMGLSATNARRIVYVVDASGSMITWMQTVIDGLIRSLDGLTPEQDFTVMFSQGDRVLIVPPTNQLHIANDKNKLRAVQWIDEQVIPGGSSNPIKAIENALRLNPDVVFLLSTNITGRGIYEIDQQQLLNRLEELNPENPETGRRQSRINCIQFLDPDPLQTLKKIAARHGGPNGYKFVDREELGIASP